MPAPPPLRAGARVREIASTDQLLALIEAGATAMDGWRLEDLDLTSIGQRLRGLDPAGCVLFGCTLDPADEQWLRTHGALVFPTPPDLPFHPYRATLYSPAELYDSVAGGGDYADSTDARCYAFARDQAALPGRHQDIAATLAMAVHDHAVTDAFTEALHAAPTRAAGIGVMGGHAVHRGTDGYAGAAHLAAALTSRGFGILTGGGPGAMEAANLGAACGTAMADLDRALADLATVPSFRPSVQAWVEVALDVRGQIIAPAVEGATRSLSVPTWFYGHEPPNVFASGIAKFFSNPLREDLLLTSATAGVVVLPGAAGTVQEIFQVATQLFYAAENQAVPPLVLVGYEHWTREVPVWPVLRSLAAGSPAMGRALHLVRGPDEVLQVLTA